MFGMQKNRAGTVSLNSGQSANKFSPKMLPSPLQGLEKQALARRASRLVGTGLSYPNKSPTIRRLRGSLAYLTKKLVSGLLEHGG